MIKRTKGVEIGGIHFHNTFECIWFKHAFGFDNHEFWRCVVNTSYTFLYDKNHGCIIYMMYNKNVVIKCLNLT
jgi:hypothetical protein